MAFMLNAHPGRSLGARNLTSTTGGQRMQATTERQRDTRLAARAVDAVKVYGRRDAAVRALASRPEIVFADEPTGNLDSRSGAELLGFLQGAVQQYGQTIVMVTHDPVAAAYAGRVVFLADGRVVDEMAQPTAERVLDR